MKPGSSPLWIGGKPLVLASSSAARRSMLINAGLEIEAMPADLDERLIEAETGANIGPRDLASMLAQKKALTVSLRAPGRMVLGADQTLDLDGVSFAKAANRAEAVEHLKRLSGRSHRLHSAYCFARDGAVVAEGAASAELAMRALTENFISAYLDAAGPGVIGSVGVYQLEGAGNPPLRLRRRRLVHDTWLALAECHQFLAHRRALAPMMERAPC